MTAEPKIDPPAVGRTPTGEAAASVSPKVRIRWGWFVTCIVLGLTAITVGWFLAAPSDRLGYVGGVLAGIGTTLLLVGVVVLLERRIIDTAVKVVRNAAREARVRNLEEVRAQSRDLEERVATVWQSGTPEEAAAQMRQMIDEFTERVADGFPDGHR
ncbi:hypothetical protein [Agromyces neolithicus]|uniref:Uncharacterized protein n=1 Tax=Agromyces neolithicus TaxID=269420 RepID=A0ABP4YF83_9MICO